MVQEDYKKLKKQFTSLPDFQDLDHEFEVSSIEKEFLLRNVKKKIDERLTFLSSLMSDILQPTPDSFESMYECNYFTADDKEELIKVFKQVQFFLRALAESSILLSDEHDAHLINEITQAMPDIRQKMVPYVQKLKDIWKKEADPKEVMEYFG